MTTYTEKQTRNGLVANHGPSTDSLSADAKASRADTAKRQAAAKAKNLKGGQPSDFGS